MRRPKDAGRLRTTRRHTWAIPLARVVVGVLDLEPRLDCREFEQVGEHPMAAPGGPQNITRVSDTLAVPLTWLTKAYGAKSGARDRRRGRVGNVGACMTQLVGQRF
jgi:hypothetical protein